MLEKYPGAPATKDALILLIKNYNNLGSSNLAEETAKFSSQTTTTTHIS